MKISHLFPRLLWLLQFLALASCNPSGQSSATPTAASEDSLGVTEFNPDEQISAYVRRIFRDSKGRLWMGTNGDGVYVHDGKQLRQYTMDQGLAGNQVTGILESADGKIWIATDEGVSRFDGSTFKSYRAENGLTSSRSWCILQDREGVIWAGTDGGLYHLESERFVELPLPKVKVEAEGSRIAAGAIRCLMEDGSGHLWIGTELVGALVYDGMSFGHLNTREGLGDNSITCIVIDHARYIWLSTMSGGVSRYDGTTFKHFNHGNGDIGDDECWTILCDHAGDIWFSSEGFGIYRYDGHVLTRLGEDDGLMVVAVQSIVEDKPGRIWVGGGGGLYRYDGQRFVNVLKGGPWE